MSQTESVKPTSLIDGCHRYGWLITIIVNCIFLAFFTGSQTQRIEDLSHRLGRLEAQIDDLARITRGIK